MFKPLWGGRMEFTMNKDNKIPEVEEEFAVPVNAKGHEDDTIEDKQPEKAEKKPSGGKKKKKRVLPVLIAVVIIAAAAAVGVRTMMTGKGLPFISGEHSYVTAEKAKEAADKLVNDANDLQGAVQILDANMDKDTDGSLKAARETYFYWLSENKQREAYQHIRNYDYVAAAQVLEPITALNKDNAEPNITKLYNTCIAFANAVEWTGDVEHVFFHSLIYDPAATFIGDYQTQDYNDNYVTVNEFKRILDRLYENNFVLYDIRRLYTVNADGTVSKNAVYVPEGKRPIVMSFDDACYYDYMKPYGFVQGVDIGPDGMPRTFKYNDDGSREYIEDGDYQPILEKFVKEHPDFSYGGAKGTMALTGYEGVLGYRTNELDSPEYEQRVQEARAVATGLKELGWSFASHSYGHRDFYERDNVWYGIDTARWEAEVAPIIGGTDIYIYPFGTNPTDWNDPKQTDFIAHGFKIFCGVYREPQLEYYDNFVFMQRRNIDGIAFADGRLNTLMDMTGIEETEVRPH